VGVRRVTEDWSAMSGSTGFQVDLDDLNTLANVNIPFIEQTCTDAGNSVKSTGQDDGTMFDGSDSSTLYLDVSTTFTETRADLENLLGALSSSLADCATALREIHRRYQDADDHNAVTLRRSAAR
jgi:hypothetical protein